MVNTFNVPVVELTKNKVVVNLNGHLVNLVGLIDNIKIKTPGDPNVSYNDLRHYHDNQLKGPYGEVYKMVYDENVTCDIPYEIKVNGGGHHTKSHRPRPRHRRTTRRR